MPATLSHEEILQRAQAIHDQVRAWRREIHRYPELSFTEHRTSGLVTGVLGGLGIPLETEVAKTGVVGHIQGGDGPLVGLRADMDALPIQEINGTDFDSTRPGIMHACGHDAHTAMLLGAATILNQLSQEQKLPGSVRLLFQPSEEDCDAEGKSGGRRMVEEGALQGVQAVFGLHVAPKYEVGVVATRVGPLLASADQFYITIHGAGGHAARPHASVDPIALSALVIQAIHQIVSRRVNPLEPAVITIGSIHGGTATNIIPDSVELTGTVRAYSHEARETMLGELVKVVRLVEPLGGRAEIRVERGYPPTVNDAEATSVMTEAVGGLLGGEHVLVADPSMGAEDFSYMAQAAPGCFLNLGVKNPGWDQSYPVHRADFRLDEDALPIGTAALVAAALQWMETHG